MILLLIKKRLLPKRRGGLHVPNLYVLVTDNKSIRILQYSKRNSIIEKVQNGFRYRVLKKYNSKF